MLACLIFYHGDYSKTDLFHKKLLDGVGRDDKYRAVYTARSSRDTMEYRPKRN